MPNDDRESGGLNERWDRASGVTLMGVGGTTLNKKGGSVPGVDWVGFRHAEGCFYSLI